MRIAAIGMKGLPPRQGGIEHHCAALYPEIVGRGHSVDCFVRSSYVETPWGKRYNFQGVNIIPLPSPWAGGCDAFINSAMASALTGPRYEVVHFHALGPALFSWLPKLRAASTKVVVTCHGIDWQREKWGRFSKSIIRAGEKAAVRFADQIIVVSENLQTYFRKTYGRETVYIPNAPAKYVDSDENFSFISSLGLTPQKYVLFLGRLVPEKCPHLLIQAFRHLKPQGWKLAIAGGMSGAIAYVNQLFELAQGDPNIIFMGELQGRILAETVRGAGLFVLPSNLEGMPLSMLEAMIENVPVVASDIDPHQKLLGDRRGVLFKSGHLDDFSRALEWAIQNPDKMSEMARNAQIYAKKYHSWERIADETLHVYGQLSPTLSVTLSYN
ncbi:MAG: glycosyltransferase family 4 protein [Synechococcales bacterium]|nr:glycosyltransferase family 4 protein [Synechococcales bacterium]